MKFRRLFKKAAAALMAAVTALSVLPATTAFAAGDIGTISFTHTYDSSGNTMRYNSSAVFDGYTAGGTGKYKYRMFVDGENAFCIQPGVPLKTGNTLKKASSDTWNALSTNQKKAVGLALLYGYQGNRSHLSGSDDEKWLATQTLVWEFVTGCREATGSYQQNSTKAYSLHFGSNYPNSGAKAAYDQIVSLLSEHNTIPSFMPYGIYTVHQTSGWDGRELMKDFDVFISADGQTYRFLINNANFESYIKIVKKDAETGNTIPYAGAGFQIYDPNGNLVTMTFTYPEVTTIDTFYTTADGDLITPQTLEYGTGYSLVEVQAPYGYVLNSEPVYFDVAQDNSTEESGITVIEVVRSNMAQKGTITVSKSGEVFSSVFENNGLYQPIFAVSGLEGAVYEITAAEDIYTLDGTLRASKGEVVDTITTGADGTAKSKELYLGKYEVKEITAPFGMVLNDEIHSVELVYAGQNMAVTETATSFYNERQRVEIDLTKSLEVDKNYGIGNNGEIFDVTFGLYAEKDIVAADGTVISADGLIEIISFDENGYGKATTDLPFGSYYVKEISTNSAYIISDQKYPVTFEYQGQDTATVHITANDGEAIENKLIYGSVSGKKSDEDGKALGGAVIGIFKAGTEEFTKENAIQTTTSKDDGSFSFAKVPYGTWIIREIESPKGFVLSEEEIAVTIGKVDEAVEIEMVNYFIKGNIELTKVDKDYPDNKLSGAVFEVFADTNGNGEFDKDDELLGEMTELDGGVYQMKDLRYGKYFVREKAAPTGFVLDENVYTVSIDENGKTYVVENEAGKGFVNAAQAGSLKIVKTSSDGKVEGFSFRVTGVNGYDKTFTTDRNGEIFVEGLRIGDYTVSEVNDKASAGYILPADKQLTIKVGATTIVQMHNEFRDTPKTGDDFNLGLWVSLSAVSLAGAGVLGFIGFKNRKKKED